jgi:alpha-D-ribose 1-methylphosphonate 5-triphosphate diphosphatase PhnM
VFGHDAVLASCGITTVLDSPCIGDLGSDGFRADTLISSLEAITHAQRSGELRIDHQIHFRCEVADPRTPSLFDDLCDNPLLRLGLAEAGLLDIVTSDYVSYSLLHAPFLLAERGVLSLAHALALVTARPAEAVGLADRGRLEAGRRADLVRVRLTGDVPAVRGVFSRGQQVG